MCVCFSAGKQMRKKESPPYSPEPAHERRRDIVKTTKYEIRSCLSQEGKSVRTNNEKPRNKYFYPPMPYRDVFRNDDQNSPRELKNLGAG